MSLIDKKKQTKMNNRVEDVIDIEEDYSFDPFLDNTYCGHTPDNLDLLDWEASGDTVTHLYRCKCGKNVSEFFTFSERYIN